MLKVMTNWKLELRNEERREYRARDGTGRRCDLHQAGRNGIVAVMRDGAISAILNCAENSVVGRKLHPSISDGGAAQGLAPQMRSIFEPTDRFHGANQER